MNTLSLGILNQSSVRIEVWYDGTSLRSQIHNARFSPYLCVRRAVQKEESRSRVVLEVLSISHLQLQSCWSAVPHRHDVESVGHGIRISVG